MKFSPIQVELIDRITRTVQIIAVALSMGVMVFGGVILGLGLAPEEAAETPIISIISAIIAFAVLAATMVVPGFVASSMMKKVVEGKPFSKQSGLQYPEEAGDVGPLLGIYQTKQIVRLGLLEGAAFFNLIACMLEGHLFSLGIVVGLLCSMFFTFPSRDGVERFVREQLQAIEHERDLRG